eukprot:2589795-Pyramimonas_sp.AAC.1
MPHLPHGIDGVVDERVREMHHMYFPWQSDDIFTAPDTLLKMVMGNGVRSRPVRIQPRQAGASSQARQRRRPPAAAHERPCEEGEDLPHHNSH